MDKQQWTTLIKMMSIVLVHCVSPLLLVHGS